MTLLLSLALVSLSSLQTSGTAAPLPAGVRAVWDLDRAWRQATPTSETVCLNGLWRWQPAVDKAETIPTGGWGWFKVPGSWPGITDYLEKDCQTVITHPNWKAVNLGAITSAWYQREFTVPKTWSGRRIALKTSYVNSLATVFVDQVNAGSISFPDGEVDVTKLVRPGEKHLLSVQVVALPLKGVITSYTDTNAAKQMRATVARRGLCGDVYLVGEPAGARIETVAVEPSVRNGALTVRAGLAGLDQAKIYRLQAKVLDRGQTVATLKSEPFHGAWSVWFTRPWKPGRLWDLNTPENQFDLELTLTNAAGKPLDVQAPKRFGFRELWIKGRDFILNGTRVFWSCVPMDNAQISAQLSSYEGAKESMRRLKSFGINMVYTHNYDCNPGSYLAFDEILRAADDVGMLVALTQPHFGDYDWSTPDAETTNGYARQAAFFARVAANHPSVVAYSTSHNACGYNEDMNPDLIDGLFDQRDPWSLNNMKKAVRAEAIIKGLDPSRIVYHHSSGNLGSMHTMNFYLNMAPVQELDDWFEHWATKGGKPAFTVEYGVPFSWDWSMYRGWYEGKRSFGSAAVPWEYCMPEWNAQFLGDGAYNLTDAEKRNLRWEAQKFRSKQLWHRWDYPYPMGSNDRGFEDQQKVWADYTADNWRAFRTWGVSGISPWETHEVFWRLKSNVNRGRVELPTDWDNLQRPGYSPDYLDQRYERFDLAYNAFDWEPTTGGLALIRNNAPLLIYIAGKPGAFTEKGHNFHAGDTVGKQLVIVNNSRETVRCRCTFLTEGRPLPPVELTVPTGEIHMHPLEVKLPADFAPGAHKLWVSVAVAGQRTFEDGFTIDVLPPAPPVSRLDKLAIFDPKGETTKLLTSLGVAGTAVKPGEDLTPYGTLVIGKGALTTDGQGLDLTRVRQGLKVILFEQTSDVLEQRFGFRVQEYGLRKVFLRVSGHSALAGLSSDNLHDWRGEATTMASRLQYQLSDRYNGAPAITRSGLLVTRAWRCGNRGNVASVLIEKPAVGDFMPILDGGFSLQYSPLMEYREGKGMVLFCQMDVTGRTEADPSAERLVVNLLNYVSSWRPQPERSVVYAGDAPGRQHLERAGFSVSPFNGTLKPDDVLAIGPAAESALAPQKQAVAAWAKKGGHVFAVGLGEAEMKSELPAPIAAKTEEYIGSAFEPPSVTSPFAGIGAADLHNRDPRPIALITQGATEVGGGALAATSEGSVVLFQLAPWTFDVAQPNTKRVFRHTSFALSRLLGNLGVHASTPLLERFSSPARADEKRWLNGFYLDRPEEADDPYRFFRW